MPDGRVYCLQRCLHKAAAVPEDGPGGFQKVRLGEGARGLIPESFSRALEK